MIRQQQLHEGLSVTFVTSMSCNMACRYCYEFNKPQAVHYDKTWWERIDPAFSRTLDYSSYTSPCEPTLLPLSTAKTFIDSLLTTPISAFTGNGEGSIRETAKKGIILDFIGGDSLQEPELLDSILEYWARRLWSGEVCEEQKDGWRFNWRASVSSNGVTLLDPEARRICEKWKDNLSLGISVDGTPELHDANRILFARRADGSDFATSGLIWGTEITPGETVASWYQKTFPDAAKTTKFTIAPNSYAHLCSSYEWLYQHGYRYFGSNRVMENNMVDTRGQRDALAREFIQLYHWVKLHRDEVWALPLDYHAHCTFGKREDGVSGVSGAIRITGSLAELIRDDPNYHHCGLGNMLALHPSGDVYSCFRLIDGHSSRDMTSFAIGNAGEPYKKQEVMNTIRRVSAQTNYNLPEPCTTCPLLKTCPSCIAGELAQTPGEVTDDGYRVDKQYSACYWHKLQTYYSMKYWRTEMEERGEVYRGRGEAIDIWWDQDYEDTILGLPEAGGYAPYTTGDDGNNRSGT